MEEPAGTVVVWWWWLLLLWLAVAGTSAVGNLWAVHSFPGAGQPVRHKWGRVGQSTVVLAGGWSVAVGPRKERLVEI